jgi:hypothetical protein
MITLSPPDRRTTVASVAHDIWAEVPLARPQPVRAPRKTNTIYQIGCTDLIMAASLRKPVTPPLPPLPAKPRLRVLLKQRGIEPELF